MMYAHYSLNSGAHECAKCESNVPNQLIMKAWKSASKTYTHRKKRYSSEEQLNISKHHRNEHTYTSYNSQCDFHANQ